jgi:hypothetical protein
MNLRSPARSLGVSVSLLAGLALAGAAAAQEQAAAAQEQTATAQERSAAAPHHAGLRTATLLFPAPGVMIAELGIEYLPDVTNDLAGVDGEIVRAPTVGLKLGLSDQAMFQVSWPAYNRLRVHSQQEPPPLGRRLGRVSGDWGDLTVATLIRLHDDQGRWPSTGVRFAAKLPNTNEKRGIGDNTTDVFASALFAKSFASRARAFADIGLGILSARTTAFTQNDVLTYSMLSDWRVREHLTLVGEVTGQASTHDGGPGTGSRSELRAGFELARRSFHWSALAVHGLSGWDSRGVGVSLNVSRSFAALERAARAR